ncbi:hypothetical protein [Labrys monachus]|uniref:Uncharacterized protein n=1 Tax=Labrys monachus TaxID=217067 RepID=A0ABU0F9Z6_9HYPH|nr:hypothetical protein [Labrys monachus]MDQ0391447.1 hypothetical protein [Labrys monachus]
MSIEPIGIVTFLAGFLVLWFGPLLGIFFLTSFSLLGAAAAIQLPALGGTSIQPVHLMLAFFALSVMLQPKGLSLAMQSLTWPGPGYWLLMLVAYGVLTAVLLPRLFSGATVVFSPSRSAEGGHIITTALKPGAANITQTFYFASDLLCFAAIPPLVIRGGTRIVVRAIMVAAGLDLFFAVADLVTYVTHAPDVLAFIRNANYRLLDDGEIGGFKRIVGSFSEASAYGYATVGLYAFCLQLWLRGVGGAWTLTLSIALLMTLVLSTSTTVYATLAAYSLIVSVQCVTKLSRGDATSRMLVYLIAEVTAALALLALAALRPSVLAIFNDLFSAAVTNKLTTQSGIERSSWNTQAWRNTLDTLGMGTGLGSVRASTLVLAILANLGVVGLFGFGALFGSLAVARRTGPALTDEDHIGRAAISTCTALVIAALIGSPGVDLGLPFYTFAGLAGGLALQARGRRAAVPQLRAVERTPAMHGSAA